MTEHWKPIPGFDGYEVSDLGRVRSKRGILSPIINSCGNSCVAVYKKQNTIARLVLLAFCGEPEPGHRAHHINGDRMDNRLENLRWATHSEVLKGGA